MARKIVCLKRLGGSRKVELRVGRFLGHEKVTTAEIIANCLRQTGAACAGLHVVALMTPAR